VGGLAGPIPFVGGNMIQPVFFVGDDGRVRMLARTGTELLPSGKKARTRSNSFLSRSIHPRPTRDVSLMQARSKTLSCAP
jgi:hypothetical protein